MHESIHQYCVYTMIKDQPPALFSWCFACATIKDQPASVFLVFEEGFEGGLQIWSRFREKGAENSKYLNWKKNSFVLFLAQRGQSQYIGKKSRAYSIVHHHKAQEAVIHKIQGTFS